MTLTSPPYSFVFFSPLGAETPLQMALPFAKEGDLKFQFILTVATEAIGDAVMSENISLRLINGTASITDDTSLIANTLHNYSDGSPIYFNKYRISDTKILFYWSHGLPNFSSYLAIGTCFKLAFAYSYGGDTVIGISNTFKVTDDLVFTTQVTYSCLEDSNSFTYCVTGGTVPNVARVGFYPKKIPQFTTEDSIYQKSDGAIIYLKSVTKKEYQCHTDYMDASTHEKLNVALTSDSCIIDNDTYSGGIIRNGAYELDQLDIPGDIDIAQAKFKVFATPYNVRNNNCSDC